MLKKRFMKKIAAAVIAATVIFTNAVPYLGTMNAVEAASTYANDNLLVNSDFEEDKAFSPAGQSHLGNWFFWQSASKTTSTAQSGNASVQFTGNESSLEQDIEGLQPGLTYVFTVWAKVSATGATADHTIGIKNHGSAEVKKQVTSTEWEKYEIEFVSTTGKVRVFGWVDQLQGVTMYIDNASLTVKSEVKNIAIENGKIDVEFNDTFNGQLSTDSFSATYRTSADDTAKELAVSIEGLSGNILTMSFAPVEAIAVEQTVTVNLTYKGQTIMLDYVVEASGEAVVTADIVSVDAENGSVTVVLSENPTVAPTVADFVWKYSIGSEAAEAFEVTDFVYNKETKTVTAAFDEIRGIPSGEQTVKVDVTYNEKTVSDSFKVAVGKANTYYVDSTLGDDANDGLSEDKAFATIDKLNTITFIPGDQILFKKGETFVGCFKPQGSGTKEHPIIIGSYGEGTDRPVLQPGEDWTVDYVMSANAIDRNVKVNYVIQFYNVEFWEASGLEIADPDSEKYFDTSSPEYLGTKNVYRSGITVQAEDIGTLEHIYIDDMIIHGFHGPLTNLGKTSGGITMNVITNGDRNRALSVPTQINDIRVTNCEIYDVGRSGINFLTPWSFRNEEKWGPFDYGTRGYDYLPYEDFYMANNYIHDVDGDGTIIDNCSNAVSEYNLVTRCCLQPQLGGGSAAVGLFNWNSDDTYFQFNEVYDIRPGYGSYQANDNQGIEIDALNDRTWVQYNYVHDNFGGFMMLCNVGDNYRSFDGIIRYNISQNDYAHSRQGLFDIYSANYGTEVYNNTFYLTERALKPNSSEIFLFSAVGAYETMKFYNNIFYYDGETPAAANMYGDDAIDWQSNIFYGFTNLPKNDNAGAPNLSIDPALVDIGSGSTGTYPGDKADLAGYYLSDNSPAIDAGVPLENNGGRDYFGNKVTGIPDIGAYESGSVALKVLAQGYAFDQEEKTVTIDSNAKTTADEFLASLIYEDGVVVELKRGSAALSGGVRVAEGDVVTATYEGKTISYRVEMVAGEVSNVIPVEDMEAKAGSEETVDEDNKASNVLDGKVGTIWHTSWGGAAAADRYITIELKNDYEIFEYIYTPRTGGGKNGIITKYEIYTSDDNATWTKVASGDWAEDSEVKTAKFDTPVQAKFVKLLAVNSVGGFASAAEVRLQGERVYSDIVAPTAPVASADDVTKTSAKISWTPATDNEGVVEYRLMNGEEVIATFDPTEVSYVVTDLEEGTEYTFEVCAVDEAGNVSVAGTVTVTTLADEPEVCKHTNTEVKDAKAATCTEEGYTGDTVCKDCGEVVAKGKAIAAKGHTFGKWTVVKEATTETEGLEERVCACGEKETRTIAKLPVENPEQPDEPNTPTDPEQPETDDKEEDKSPVTGDATSVMLWAIVMMMAAAVVIVKRKETK